MDFTDSQIMNFQEIYQRNFGERLSRDQAEEKGGKLITFIRAVHRLQEEQRIKINQ